VPDNPSDPFTGKIAAVTPGYFEAMKIPLLRGRTFDERDTDKAKAVAIVDEQFASRSFPKGEAIGKFIQPDSEYRGGGTKLWGWWVVFERPT
jgi:hypothetical protein